MRCTLCFLTGCGALLASLGFLASSPWALRALMEFI